MAKAARFVGDPNDPTDPGSGPNKLTFKGVEFTKNEWTNVDDATAEKLSKHTHFEVMDLEDEK